MNTLACTTRQGLAGGMEIFHLLLALVIVGAAWVLVTQLLNVGSPTGVSNDRFSHSD